METSTRQVGDATIVQYVGSITLYNTPTIRKELLGLIKEKKCPYVLVDMRQVKYIDSSGVAALVEALKSAMEAKTRFGLFGLTPTTKEVLSLTRLLHIFEVHDTEEQALTAPPPTTNLLANKSPQHS